MAETSIEEELSVRKLELQIRCEYQRRSLAEVSAKMQETLQWVDYGVGISKAAAPHMKLVMMLGTFLVAWRFGSNVKNFSFLSLGRVLEVRQWVGTTRIWIKRLQTFWEIYQVARTMMAAKKPVAEPSSQPLAA